MSYENAPATKMVATHCACCDRPLVDAKSVECGVGPVCREKHGFDIECNEEARAEANKLVYSIAVDRDGLQVVDACKRLFELGFTNLVVAILKRIAAVQVALTDDTHPHGAERLAVRTPYSVECVNRFRSIPGRRWDKESKLNTFPQASKGALWAALSELFAGQTGIGPKGPFIVGQKPAQAPQVAFKAVA
jgi:hypothetical protein